MRRFHNTSSMGRGDESGPLLSEHLRDLDLELELLKRKREMIEKQQSLLNQQQAFNRQSYSYDQPQSFRDHYDEGPQFNAGRDFSSSNRDYSNSGRDFSHLYSEPQQSRDRFPRQSAKKRLGDYVWSDPPNKRPFGPANKFAGPSNKFASGPANKFGSGPSSKQSKYVAPSQTFARPQPGKPKPSERFKAPRRSERPRPTDFKPTKVVKPKTTFPKKPHAPKPLVADAVPKSDQEVAPILQPDQAPTQQMAGRLELALGNILKVVKDKYSKDPQYKQFFLEHISSRAMKQEIRERIRQVMIGKPVGHVIDIIKLYREVYPDSTDKEIVECGVQKKTFVKTAGEIKNGNSVLVTDSTLRNPYVFFKRNFSNLLSQSLNKMFTRIEAISKEESPEKERLQEENNTSTSDEVTAQAEEEKPEGSESYDPEIPTADEVSDDKVSDDIKEQEVTEKSNKEDVSEEPKDENVSEDHKDEANPDESKEDDATSKANEENIDQDNKYSLSTVHAQYEKMMNAMMPKKLAFWMPRLKGQIMKALIADCDFRTVRRQIVKETEALMNKEQNPDTSTTEATKPATTEAKKPKLKYYVKIQGRPMLPKKQLMKPFLDQFNPKVVKKIKSLRNLLFVGFENKSDFDRIIAANGTVVGTDKIIVKISTWVTNEALNAPSETTSTPNTSTISDGDVTMSDANTTELNSSLDNQIDELLTSIRNEKEAGDGENQEGDEGDADENVENGEENANDDENAENNEENANKDENAENNEENVNEDKNAENNEENTNLAENTKAENDDCGADAEEQANGEAASNENETTVQEGGENNEQENIEAKDKVEELKSDAKETGKATPTRASTRLATSTPTTPSTIRTRRASRLAQN